MSMLPPPVCTQPSLQGVTWPWRSPRVIETDGEGGAGAVTVIVTGVPGGTVLGSSLASAASGVNRPRRPAYRSFFISLRTSSYRQGPRTIHAAAAGRDGTNGGNQFV